MDYYIQLNNIVYIDIVEEKEKKNDDQVSKNEIKKKSWQKIKYLWYINEAS